MDVRVSITLTHFSRYLKSYLLKNMCHLFNYKQIIIANILKNVKKIYI